MKVFIKISILLFLFGSFINCSTAQKLQTNSPVSFGEPYVYHWVAGVQGGGSGSNLFIPITSEIPQDIHLDSVYFNDQVVKLERVKDKDIFYVGRFRRSFNQREDIIMSSDLKEEYGNKAPKTQDTIPFELKDDECVVSYQSKDKTHYFKIGNIVEKQVEEYPNASSKKQ